MRSSKWVVTLVLFVLELVTLVVFQEIFLNRGGIKRFAILHGKDFVFLPADPVAKPEVESNFLRKGLIQLCQVMTRVRFKQSNAIVFIHTDAVAIGQVQVKCKVPSVN